MVDLCVSSNVTTRFLNLTSNEIQNYTDSKVIFSFDSNQVEKKIDFYLLTEIEQIVDKKILILLESVNIEIELGRIYTTIFYKGQTFRINIHENEYATIARLTLLNELIHKTIIYEGTIYLFNKSALNRFRTENVLALMKVKKNVTLSEIETEINKLTEEYSSVNKINRLEIEQSIEYLKSLGFIDNDDYDENKYRLTAKGYMLVL